jgi:hypothetical protein
MGACVADPVAVMDSALAAGARHLYTEYKGKGHVIWAESYNLPQLQRWVFAQSLDEGAGAADRGGPAGAGEFTLSPGYPNPFNPSVRVRYSLPADARVRLEVLDALGRRVATLKNGPERAGVHEAVFEAGARASGAFFFRLEAGGSVVVRKAVLAR